jgi:L-aspartate oxidase
MTGRHPLADLAPRDVVARSIDEVMRRDRSAHVWLDATGIGAQTFERRFPTVSAACRRVGIDPGAEPIPVAPAAHFLCGGVRTDKWGATDVPGLYAVGEVAATGVHGANRLASSGMLEGLVFGRRLAARLVLALPDPSPYSVLPPSPAPAVPAVVADRIRAVMSRDVGIRRSAEGLARAARELDSLGSGPMVEVARAVVAAATIRTESRGCHWRVDHPQTHKRWTRRILVRAGSDDRPVTTVGPRIGVAE